MRIGIHHRHFPWLFALLVIVTSWAPDTVYADGVNGAIHGGQPVNGTLSAVGVDTYTFNVTAGSSFVVAVSETGSYLKGFAPEIDLVAPVSNDGPGLGRSRHSHLEETNAAEGSWSVKVHRADVGGTKAGAYTLSLIQVPGAVGSALSPGVAKSGSMPAASGVDVWTFSGTKGHTATLTLNKTGGTGFFPEIHVFAPNGDFAGGFGCGLNCANDFQITADGVYTALVLRNDNTAVAGTYTVSVADKN